jgi:ATP-dependent Lhr-like helicase
VLTRDAVRAEAVPGGFAGIYPVLKTLEESGRIRRGYFVAGLGGAQFALPGAVDRLRAPGLSSSPAAPSSLPAGAERVAPVVHLIAATDPANAYGVAVPWPVRGPSRAPGAYVILVDGIGAAYLERGGKGLVALREADGSWEEAVAATLASMVAGGRWRRLMLQRYPDGMGPILEAAGFIPTPKGLVKYG